jgi:uncharacterized Tic20 family protein
MDHQERMIGMWEHLLAFVGLLVPYLGNILAPLILWLVKREGSMFIDEQGKESVNFQISMTIYAIAASILIAAGGLGIPLVGVIFIVDGVCVIIAAIRANRGDLYRYQVTIRFIR